MDSAPVPTSPVAATSAASPEQASPARASAGARIVARAVERLSEQRYLLARDGRVFLAQSATELPTGRDLRLVLARPGKPALLAPLAQGESGGLGSAQVSGRVRPAGSGQLLLSTALGEELVRVSQGPGDPAISAGQGRFRVLEPAEPAQVRLVQEVAAQAARAQTPPAPEGGRSGLLASLLRHFLPVRQSPADVLTGTRELLAAARAARGGLGANAPGSLPIASLEQWLASEVWRPEEGAAGLRAHLRGGGGRLASRFLEQLLSGRSQPGFAAALVQALGDPDAPGGREAWQRLGEALLGEEFNSASRSDAAQLGLIVAERDQLRDVWLRWGDGRGRRRRPGSAVKKLAVGVDFSATGRVRADLLWSAERLRVRLRAERPEVAEHLRGDRAELEALLCQGGVEAALTIECGAAHPPGRLDADGPLVERTG